MRVRAVRDDTSDHAANRRAATGPTLDIYGYGQVNFSYEIENEEGPASHTSTNAFAIGGLDLFLVSQLTDEVSFLSEIFLGPKGQDCLLTIGNVNRGRELP